MSRFQSKLILSLITSVVITVAAMAVVPARQAHAQAAAVTTPPYATILFGRSGWVGNNNCVPYPGAVNLGQAVQWLASQGVPAVGGVVTGYTNESTPNCTQKYITYPSWQDLQQLHTQYGFEVVSQSATYNNWLQATTDSAITAESCDTLPIFQAHGFTRAWGMFNYPNNQATAAQQKIVTTCFSFGRKYGTKITSQAQALVYPHTLKTLSVISGNCNDAALPCYTAFAGGRHYMLPSAIIPNLNPTTNQYGVVQFYRFVGGVNLTGPVTWDCTAADPQDHWVSKNEIYCFNDFQAVVMARGASVTFTDPATVATAWGMLPH